MNKNLIAAICVISSMPVFAEPARFNVGFGFDTQGNISSEGSSELIANFGVTKRILCNRYYRADVKYQHYSGLFTKDDNYVDYVGVDISLPLDGYQKGC